MQIAPINNSPDFRKLDSRYVTHYRSWKLVRNERSALEELGKKYNIKLSSEYDSFFDKEYINVVVSDLGNKLNLWQKLFSAKGQESAEVGRCDSVVNLVERAIESLHGEKPSRKKIKAEREAYIDKIVDEMHKRSQNNLNGITQ